MATIYTHRLHNFNCSSSQFSILNSFQANDILTFSTPCVTFKSKVNLWFTRSINYHRDFIVQKICHVLVDYPHKIQNISPCSIHAYFGSIDVEHYIWLIRRYLTELDNHTLYLPLYYQQVISGIQRCKVKINGMDEGRKITMCAVYDSGLSCSAPFILAR